METLDKPGEVGGKLSFPVDLQPTLPPFHFDVLRLPGGVCWDSLAQEWFTQD